MWVLLENMLPFDLILSYSDRIFLSIYCSKKIVINSKEIFALFYSEFFKREDQVTQADSQRVKEFMICTSKKKNKKTATFVLFSRCKATQSLYH